jgi:hypothetical protein
MLYRTPEPERKSSAYRHPRETEAMIVMATMAGLCVIALMGELIYRLVH